MTITPLMLAAQRSAKSNGSEARRHPAKLPRPLHEELCHEANDHANTMYQPKVLAVRFLKLSVCAGPYSGRRVRLHPLNSTNVAVGAAGKTLPAAQLVFTWIALPGTG